MKSIEIVAYNENWPGMFEKEASFLKQVMGDNCIAIHHIGSTSVPRLIAKPIIDIIMVVKKITEIAPALEKLEYKSKGELNIPFRQYSTKESDLVKFHLHVYEEENPEIQLNLLFRNYLRNSSAAREEYTTLKVDLLNQKLSHEKGNSRFSGYTLGKDAFIKKVLEQAGFSDFCIRFCTHHAEWEAYHRIRKEQIFDLTKIQYDPHHPTITDPDHFHFVLYKGTKIIGVAHLEFLAVNEAALRPFAIDAPYQNQGIGTKFLVLLEKWLKLRGKTVIRLHANKRAQTFYERSGYKVMTFHGYKPSLSSSTIDMGKEL